MEFPRAPIDYDVVQPSPPPSLPAKGAPSISNRTVKEYDPEDTWGGWPKPPPGQIGSQYQAMLDDWDAEIERELDDAQDTQNH